MRAIPFEEDWRELDQPDALQPLLKDAASLLKSLNRLERALEYEGTHMQGAGTVRVYLEDLRAKFERAEELDRLFVGKIVELRRVLFQLSQREALRSELAHFCEPLDEIVRRLTEILQTHFSATLARFSPLRVIELGEDSNPRDVLCGMREMVSSMRDGANGNLPPLQARDAASLDLLLDDLERLILALEIAHTPEQMSTLKREINFAMAKFLASGFLYLERANEVLPKFSGRARKTNELIDDATKIERRVITLERWIAVLLDALKGS